MSNQIVFNEKAGEQSIQGGRKVTWLMKASMNDSQCTSICTVEVEPLKRVTPAHAHTNAEETVYIISGNGKVLVGNQISEIGPGSLVYFPVGVPHMLWNNGTEPMKGVCFYAPSKEEIIYEYHENVDFPEFK